MQTQAAGSQWELRELLGVRSLNEKFALARHLMTRFAEESGLTGNTDPRRYLWTDAFAVCNFLGLYRRTKDDLFLGRARELVSQVHQVLGRHRGDDPRSGWISGLSEDEGKKHPTQGGLRIGKPLNERQAWAIADPELEWEQDGQYFHYLTKWIHALACLGYETGSQDYELWAVELAKTAHRAFVYLPPRVDSKRMYWKMSIDLKRPLVSTMGQHDPLEGLLSTLELSTLCRGQLPTASSLTEETGDYARMCARQSWMTTDPLGIGGLIDDAARWVFCSPSDAPRSQLLQQILIAASRSLKGYLQTGALQHPAEYRLAFRELGLSLGIRGLQLSASLVAPHSLLSTAISQVLEFAEIADGIEEFWRNQKHQQSSTWEDHLDINRVMLATSLVPDGYFMALSAPQRP